MSISTILTAAGVILTLATASACSDDAVGPLEGRVYALQRVDGEELPVTITPAPNSRITLLADTIRFSGGDSYTRTLTYEQEEGEAAQIRVRTDTIAGTVTQRNGALTLEFPCRDVIVGHLGQCVPPDTARFIGSRLVVRSFLLPAGDKVFVRIEA